MTSNTSRVPNPRSATSHGLLIDSSTFIALERRGQTLGRLATVARMDESVALAAITAAEPLTGVHRADTRERRIVRERFVETVLASVPSLAFDVTVARVYATLWADLHAVGQIMGIIYLTSQIKDSIIGL